MESARKLRSSCDACGAAKIKCDRTQPQCGRCVSMNLACVYGPTKQLGKRPRRRLDLGPRLSNRSETPTHANSAYQGPAREGLAITGDSHSNLFDPVLDMGLTPPEDMQLPLPSEPSMVWPPLDTGLLGSRHRCYHEANEIIQLLSIPERFFPDDGPIVLDVSQILQATRRATETLNRLVDCDCGKTRGHQTMLYASLISRTLWWYREAAGDEVWRRTDIAGMPSPNESCGTMTPPTSVNCDDDRCVKIKAPSITVGGFDVDDPRMQQMFRTQLIRHELREIESLIEKFAALATDAKVPQSTKPLFISLGTWLRGDLTEAIAAVTNAGNRYEDE